MSTPILPLPDPPISTVVIDEFPFGRILFRRVETDPMGWNQPPKVYVVEEIRIAGVKLIQRHTKWGIKNGPSLTVEETWEIEYWTSIPRYDKSHTGKANVSVYNGGINARGGLYVDNAVLFETREACEAACARHNEVQLTMLGDRMAKELALFETLKGKKP